jgi:hypothetical protein
MTLKNENDAKQMRNTSDRPNTAPVNFGFFHKIYSSTKNERKNLTIFLKQ